jgi:AraC-like ligand binding domain
LSVSPEALFDEVWVKGHVCIKEPNSNSDAKSAAQNDGSVRQPLNWPGVETTAAHYVGQSFKPHAHQEYLLAVIDGGVHSVWCRGQRHQVSAGTVVTMHPGDAHHGGAGAPMFR